MSVRLITPYTTIKNKEEKIDKKKVQSFANELATKNNVSYNGDAINKINDIYKKFVRN